MSTNTIHGFDHVAAAPVTHGLAVYRFSNPLNVDAHHTFMKVLKGAGMLPVSRASRVADTISLHAIGLQKLFALGHRTPQSSDEAARQHDALQALVETCGLESAWSFHVDTCVDVTERQTTGQIRWRHGAPTGRCQVRFPVAGRQPVPTEQNVIPRLAMRFELMRSVCAETAGLLVAFCQHWMAPFIDHVFAADANSPERTDAQCFLMGDVNIDDDGRTVRYRLDHLIVPGDVDLCVQHLLGTLDRLHDVLPIKRAWIGED